MAANREERLAKNEALFRVANERMANWEERQAEPEEPEPYLCECADPRCMQKLSLTLAEYEHVRRDPCLFFLVDGHDVPDVESVVERHGDWVVVRKEEEAREVVTRTDARGGSSGSDA